MIAARMTCIICRVTPARTCRAAGEEEEEEEELVRRRGLICDQIREALAN